MRKPAYPATGKQWREMRLFLPAEYKAQLALLAQRQNISMQAITTGLVVIFLDLIEAQTVAFDQSTRARIIQLDDDARVYLASGGKTRKL